VGTGRSYRSFLSHGIPSSELEGCVRKLEVVFHYPGANVFFFENTTGALPFIKKGRERTHYTRNKKPGQRELNTN
jgi:hypothetical protein